MQPVAFSSAHKGRCVSAPAFPIMTMDEHRLTPAMGYVFNPKWVDPCESLVSILWKFARANAVAGQVTARLMGPDIDPYEGVAAHSDLIDVRRLRRTFDLPPKALRGSLIPAAHKNRCSGCLRFCRRCMARGYHSVVHQFDCVEVCPAHRFPLESACRQCGYEAPYLINVQLLEAPYRCAHCRWNYGTRSYSPASHQRMTKSERVAMCGMNFRLHFG